MAWSGFPSWIHAIVVQKTLVRTSPGLRASFLSFASVARA